MVDYEKIGKRILEQRKFIHRISQEKMAEDLGMYQADISNLEKAKNGSGITDLYKLDLIADYFDISTERLIFGGETSMVKYYGQKMELKPSTKKLSVKHEEILRKLFGVAAEECGPEFASRINAMECGPYMVYIVPELQYVVSGSMKDDPFNSLMKSHLFVLLGNEVIGCLVTDNTILLQHTFEQAFESLKCFIHEDIFDVEETLNVLNPYRLLYQYPLDEEEEKQNRELMDARTDELRRAGDDRAIIYIESVYVREDCRRNGIFRLMMDTLRKLDPQTIFWLSLEPVSGDDIGTEYSYIPSYRTAEVGQFSLNASIAERLGFTVDSLTQDLQVETVGEDGNTSVEPVQVRRIAYYLPKKIRTIMNGDKGLVEIGRARKKTAENGLDLKPTVMDVYQGAWKKYGFIFAVKAVYGDGTVFAFTRGKSYNDHWLGVSRKNPAPTGEEVETMERYDRLEDAVSSRYYRELKMSEQLYNYIFFQKGPVPDMSFL